MIDDPGNDYDWAEEFLNEVSWASQDSGPWPEPTEEERAEQAALVEAMWPLQREVIFREELAQLRAEGLLPPAEQMGAVWPTTTEETD